eukprot:TRINITY_DN987_c0_g1_i1.p1 TRINITY_DN987_c0_g1~~TRINITY_DN987_c0_g1_i1.p1  ORF type:complete len:167 (-),score=47.28 TRINITY_DN987_c0_g1_i1:42-542(-)
MAETQGYRLHHTMIRVKDSVASDNFYGRLLGMTKVAKKDFPAGKFSLTFYAYVPEEQRATIPDDDEKRWEWLWTFNGAFVELTHNWGTENDSSDFKGYHNGNHEPRGFGHLAISVPDVYKCVERLEKEGVKIIKAPDAGSMKGLAFVADPDGYWIEIIRDRNATQQ